MSNPTLNLLKKSLIGLALGIGIGCVIVGATVGISNAYAASSTPLILPLGSTPNNDLYRIIVRDAATGRQVTCVLAESSNGIFVPATISCI